MFFVKIVYIVLSFDIWDFKSGRYSSGQRGESVKLMASAYGGSNPSLPIAWVAQLAEHVFGKDEVRSANLRSGSYGSKKKTIY